ncbi:murein biosynthesis integral membrane protein MurJ [Priestia aryabhattai]|uniref:murein biosynthesis integral membrane protein MurJ n=1 Tax=Priestia aryabhattai TaxID=412384 RepID=UPI0015943B7B
MKKIVLVLGLLTVFSKFLGLVRDIMLSYFYGASSVTDAYLISLTIPVTAFSIIGTGIATSYIPMYTKISKERSKELADNYTNNVASFVIIACTVIVIIVLAFAEPIVKIFASGFEGETLKLTTNFTKISIFGIYFSGLIYVFSSYLQVKNKFFVTALMIIPYNLVAIISIMLSSFNITILAIGSVVSFAAQLFFIIPFVVKKGFKFNFRFNPSDDYLKKMIYLSLPVIIGASVDQVNILIDRTMASQVMVGGISALNYASRFNGVVQGIFVTSISTVMYPIISKMATEDNIDGLKKTLSQAIIGISLLVIPATMGIMSFVEPIVKLLFGRGSFDSHAVTLTSSALFFYSIGITWFGFREILSRAFYSLQDTKTPMINATIAMGINIILNILLSKYLGIGGIALASSISGILCAVLLFISLRKKIGSFNIKIISISFIKILCASAAMVIIAKISFRYLTRYNSDNLSLSISIIIGGLIYSILIYIMKIEDLNSIIDSIKIKFKKKNNETL